VNLIKKGKAFDGLNETIKELINIGEETISFSALKTLIDTAYSNEYKQPYHGDEVAEQLSDFVNSMYNVQRDDFVTSVLTDHRALQSDTFNLFFKCFEGWAENADTGNYDARNEGACKVSRDMIKAVN
jgi:hypothetical protein